MRRRPWLAFAIVLIGSACGPASPPPASAPDFTTRPGARRFPLAGRVVSVDRSTRQVTLAHDRVDGFMEAMTMPFLVRDEADLARLQAGDAVTATLVVDGARSWIEAVRIVDRGRS
jgi:protein SCO1/2